MKEVWVEKSSNRAQKQRDCGNRSNQVSDLIGAISVSFSGQFYLEPGTHFWLPGNRGIKRNILRDSCTSVF